MLELTHAGLNLGDRWIWRNLEFDLRAGERVAMEGPTGSGKTLLLRCLAGLDRLDEGSIRYRSRSIREWDLRRYRSEVMLLPQIPALAPGSVEENLALPWSFAVRDRKDPDRDRWLSWLQSFDRHERFLRSRTDDLSGGERQIVAFLRALQLDPRVLLLDEPTANLDPRQSRTLEELVDQWLRSDRDRAVVWTSHQPDQLDRVSDRRFRVSHDPAEVNA